MSSINGGSTLRRMATKSGSSGAIDEEGFRHAFSTVSSLPIYSSRDLSEYMTKIKESLCVNPEDWERRANALKDLRNVVGSGGHQMDEFPALLRTLETPVLGCLQDLRSQVVREASVTVAYLSQETGSKFDHFAEIIMQTLLNLIPNSAKIMSTSAITAIGFIIRNTFASRLFPIIAGGLSSKSSVLRNYVDMALAIGGSSVCLRSLGHMDVLSHGAIYLQAQGPYVCIFLDPIFQCWPVHVLERHMALIQEVLCKGVSDADQDARSATRKQACLHAARVIGSLGSRAHFKSSSNCGWAREPGTMPHATPPARARVFTAAFKSFAEKFPDQVETVLRNLDFAKRKAIERSLSLNGADDQSSAASGTSSRTASQTNLACPSAKRTTRPAMGTSGLSGSTRRPNILATGSMMSETGRKNISAYGDSHSHTGAKKISMSQPDSPGSVEPATGATKEVSSEPECNLSSEPKIGGAGDRPGEDPSVFSLAASRETSPIRTASEVDYNVGGASAARAYAKTLSSTISRRKGLGFGASATVRGLRRTSRPVPHSQDHSREGSPISAVSANAPYTYGAANAAGSVTNKRPSLSSMSDAGYSQFKSQSRRQYESDDNASETSSMCSERSGQSMPVYRRTHLRPVNGIGEIIKLLGSSQWSEKKEGLLHLKEYLRSGQPLSHAEVMRVAEVLSVIFGESSSKVITPFMETLQLFIKGYHQFLHDWIYIAMVRLFNRQGQEVLSTHQKSIADTLAVIRSHFPLNLQFACCCRFIIDDAMSPTLKVKARVLEYLKDLLVMMPVDTINNPSNEMVKSIARVIAWSTEPKSADVRRLASRVVIKLSDLNPAAFASVVKQMPKASQDQSAKLLKTYQKTATASTGSHEATSPDGSRTSNRLIKPQVGNGGKPFSPISPVYVPAVQQEVDHFQASGKNRSTSIPDGRVGVEPSSSYGQPPPLPPLYSANTVRQNGQMTDGAHHYFSIATGSSHSPAAGDSGNLQQFSPQYSYLPAKSPQQQPPTSILSGFSNDLLCPKLKKPVIGYQTLKKIRGKPTAQASTSPLSLFLVIPPSLPSISMRAFACIPATAMAAAVSRIEVFKMPPEDAITEILQELSNYNDRYEQRKACMLKLIKLLRDGTIQTWEEHSKPTLLILLESLSDTSNETRALALRVLQELVRTQGDLISDYACLTVMKILEACNDIDKGVIRSAEECAQTVARYLSQELCLRLLTTVINDNQTSLNLPAVKMQTQVIKVSSPELVQEVLPDLIPGLIAACNHEDSHMRKASIFCLVQIAIKFGDAVWDYLNELTASKKRLLRIYIDKELEGSGKSSDSVRISGNLSIA
ncbi:CLIP-associating protein [Echinococcus granulosus]|uniref:CLIP-associating protein n=1 Tax=Echinococcus granulosus TaxID=6210 RepID=W6VC90_ECHGR|nr:CLIP-associating protein [Echinococcus granulosus]EUB64464.1 CLIP-associating protein [Echinococcus granulosus]